MYLQSSEFDMSNMHNSLRPSKLLWQLPYEERQSFIENAFEHQCNEITRMSKMMQQKGGLILDKEQSAGFD